jgi:integrase
MSVYERPCDNKKCKVKHWYYTFSCRGKRFRAAIPEARTRPQAEQAEIRIRNEVFDNRFGMAGAAPKLSDFITEVYLPWSEQNKSTYRDDVGRSQILIDYFGAKRMDEITPLDVERFKKVRRETKTWRDEDRAIKTVNIELAHLSHMFNFAIDHGLEIPNPCKKVKYIRGNTKRNRYLTDEEEADLMPWLSGRRAHAKPIVTLALHTGLRCGELMKLRWSNIDFQKNLLHVVSSSVTGQSTKTGKGRILPLNSIARQVLLDLQRESDEGRIFDVDSIKRSFRYACRMAGIKNFRFHDLRHTYATRLAEQGEADAFQIAALLGHSSITMTAVYTHATGDGLRRVVEALARPNNVVQVQFGHSEGAAS